MVQQRSPSSPSSQLAPVLAPDVNAHNDAKNTSDIKDAANAEAQSEVIVKSVGSITEWLIDTIFAASVIVAPAALLAALYAAQHTASLVALGALAVSLFAVVGIYARYIVPWQLHVKRLTASDLGGFARPQAQLTHAASRRPIKVVFFSDLHLGHYKRAGWTQRVVDAVNAESPDLVLIGGDIIGHTDCADITPLLVPLGQLRASLGVFATLGNHDHGLPGRNHSASLARILPRLGVRLLSNECVQVCDDVRLVGVEEIWTECDDLPRAITGCEAGDHRYGRESRLLVLGHNPDLMLRLETEYQGLDMRDAFFLFGHTHHGQIYVPFAPGLAIPIRSNYYRGVFHTPHGSLYVSAGAGESGTPTRLNTWPEIVVFDA